MAAPKKYPDELRERAVRLVFESGRPIAHVAQDLGVHKEALRQWVRQAEADAGTRRDRLTTGERERLKALERENRELKKANEILKAASVFSPRRSTGPRGGERVLSTSSETPASPSISSAARSGYPRRPTTPARTVCPRGGSSRTRGCSGRSVSCTPPTTTPTDRGGCGRRFGAPAKMLAAAGWSG